MSKLTEKPPVAVPWSRPSVAAARTTRSPGSSTGVPRRSTIGSTTPTASASTESIGPERSRVPQTTQRTDATLEDLVLEERRQLQTTCDLGFHGAAAIRQALDARGIASPPSVRTIHRILRRGALDSHQRVRRPPPPLGWSLPQVAARRHELDSLDIIEGLVIKGGPQVEVLNGVALHGGLVASWPAQASVTAKLVVECLVEH